MSKQILDLPANTALNGTELLEIQKGSGAGSSQNVALSALAAYVTGLVGTAIKSIRVTGNLSIDVTDPLNPIITSVHVGLLDVDAGANITIDKAVPDTPVITGEPAGVQTIVDGGHLSIDVTDPENPVVSVVPFGVQTIVPNGHIVVDSTDPLNPKVKSTGVQSVVAGRNVSVDITDPDNPVVSSAAVRSIVAGNNVSVDSSDPEHVKVSSEPGAFQINGYVNTYADLPTNLSAADKNKIYYNYGDAQLYVWDGAVFPASGSGIALSGGAVLSVIAGADISVDSTDPKNPIVAVGADVARKNSAQQYSKSQTVSPVINTAATGTVTPDCSASNTFEYTVTGNVTIANPTGTSSGQFVNFLITENATGGYTITLGSNFKIMNSTSFVTTANTANMLSGYVASNGNIYCNISQ